MNYETILYRVASDVATITLNRPQALNAFSAQMRVDLLHAIHYAEENARALVITGAGRAFCAGQDLGGAENVTSIDLQRLLRDEYGPMIEALYDCSIPTIASVNGMAAGGGLWLPITGSRYETDLGIEVFSNLLIADVAVPPSGGVADQSPPGVIRSGFAR